MLTQEQNELLTRTGPGTAMGEVMRRYWIPALLSSELPVPDCPPVRLKLLGENLVAFRATDGRVGILDEFCAHRRVSLWLGRNEEQGLRCVFHGWKYDVEGKCVDMPNEPPESNFKHKIRLQAYPSIELGGMVWSYMGPKEEMPPPPKFEWTQVPESHRHITKTWEECNWLQALEGGLDTAHIGFLHWGLSEKAEGRLSRDDPRGFRSRAQAPELDVDPTDYGFCYAGIRHLGEQGNYIRAYHYIMPWTQIRPMQAMSARRTKSGKVEWRTNIAGHFWVPIDDENCMVWNWMYSFGEEPLTEEDRLERGSGNGPDHVDQHTFRSFRHKSNNWLIDRQIQKTETFTGIDGINTQDRAVQESMGPVVDRSKEHLGPADRAIIAARRLLLQAVKTVQEGGDPLGADTSYYNARAVDQILPQGVAWREALLSEMYPA